MTNHVVTESYGHYHHRKTWKSEFMIVSGFVLILFGYMSFEGNKVFKSFISPFLIIMLFIVGTILLYFGIRAKFKVKLID